MKRWHLPEFESLINKEILIHDVYNPAIVVDASGRIQTAVVDKRISVSIRDDGVEIP